MRIRDVVAVAVLVAGVASCAQLSKLLDSAADTTGKAVVEYCKLDAAAREQFRAKVAERAAPHTARIDCAAAT